MQPIFLYKKILISLDNHIKTLPTYLYSTCNISFEIKKEIYYSLYWQMKSMFCAKYYRLVHEKNACFTQTQETRTNNYRISHP